MLFAAAPDPLQPLSLWELLLAGGWVMIPLILCSVIAVALIVICFLTLRPVHIVTDDLLKRLDPLLENDDLKGASALVADRPQAVARVLDATLKFLYRHPEASGESLKAIAEAEGGKIASELHQRTLFLMDAGVLAPMFGLFGTVVGILRSFGSIAQQESSMRTMLLAGGVSQALIATAAGLIVGITALAFYSWFRGRVQYLISLLENHSTALVQEVIVIRQRSK
jgi:biopolymer transport protein ExbB